MAMVMNTKKYFVSIPVTFERCLSIFGGYLLATKHNINKFGHQTNKCFIVFGCQTFPFWTGIKTSIFPFEP